jgi:hypothetical protein
MDGTGQKGENFLQFLPNSLYEVWDGLLQLPTPRPRPGTKLVDENETTTTPSPKCTCVEPFSDNLYDKQCNKAAFDVLKVCYRQQSRFIKNVKNNRMDSSMQFCCFARNMYDCVTQIMKDEEYHDRDSIGLVIALHEVVDAFCPHLLAGDSQCFSLDYAPQLIKGKNQ